MLRVSSSMHADGFVRVSVDPSTWIPGFRGGVNTTLIPVQGWVRVSKLAMIP
jgi:hypothetical protein